MTRAEIHRLFPNASDATIRANSDSGEASGAKPQQAVHDGPLGKAKGEKSHPGRFYVRVISYRRVLLDPDNLCPKYLVDCLRYAEIIPNDRPQDIELRTTQVKVATAEEERTEIFIDPIP